MEDYVKIVVIYKIYEKTNKCIWFMDAIKLQPQKQSAFFIFYASNYYREFRAHQTVLMCTSVMSCHDLF